MAAPLFKKNTLEQTGFTLLADGFRSSGLLYKFADVVQTRRMRQMLTQHQIGYGKLSETHSISIVFVMRTGEQVQVTEQPTWFSSSTVERVAELEKIFATVSAKSFQVRRRRYVEQVERQGFFEYAGWHFHPADRKLIDVENKRAYSTQTAKLSRRYGFIGVVDPRQTTMARALTREIGFTTFSDTDVLDGLLKDYFGVHWPS